MQHWGEPCGWCNSLAVSGYRPLTHKPGDSQGTEGLVTSRRVTHSPTLEKNITSTFWYFEEMFILTGLTDMYVPGTGAHFQSDLDTCRFNFMFVKLRDRPIPPMFCFNLQTDTIFWLVAAATNHIRRDWCGGLQYTLLHSHRILVVGW